MKSFESRHWIPLAGAGSDRCYSRLSVPDPDLGSVVRAESGDVTENAAFIGLARLFRAAGLNVPDFYGLSADGKIYYLEDLGDEDLFSHVGNDDFERLAQKALCNLVTFQTLPREKWNKFVQHGPFSPRQAMFDLNYFKYSFLKPSGVVFDEERLQDELELLSERLADVPGDELGFMYRDFQSRNVMIRDGEPWFIDFQGGRLGPVLYDAVSFLWQAKASIPEDMKERLLSRYALEYGKATGVKTEMLLKNYPDLVLFRTLQVLGAYGMRGLTQRRSHFLRSIPSGLKNLRYILEKGWADSYPELKNGCVALCSLERFDCDSSESDKLLIKVFSFSYKKGYPDDFSGNGGGFIFDCRALHNPGRYDEYKSLTGRDEPVIYFLEERGEVLNYLRTVRELVFPAIERYLKRGFTSLQVGFGCTGGQHRSVYCAEHFAKSVKERFPETEVELIHREQIIKERL